MIKINNSKLDFLIFYEILNREIENISILKYELQKRGYSCKIMAFDGIEYFKYYLLHIQAKVIIVPWLRTDTNILNFLPFAEKPYKIVDLQWEQIGNESARESNIDILSQNAKKIHHLCWGTFSKYNMINKGCLSNKLPITGAIHQDFGREVFQGYYLSREYLANKYALDISKKWILYVSSFGIAYGGLDISELTKKYGQYYADWYELTVKSQKATLRWIERFLKEVDCEFIYRPHPTEKASNDIFRLDDKFNDFHIITDYSVKQWGKVCDKVNLWISTSNAELTSINVSYNIVRPIHIPRDKEMDSMIGEYYVTSYEEFKRRNTKEIEDERFIDEKRAERLNYFYDYDPTKAAYRRIADYLESVYSNDEKIKMNFSKEQRNISKRILIRTLFFSLMFNVYICCPKIVKRLPIKKEWKNIIESKSKTYCKAKEIEKATVKYLKNAR